VIKNDFSNSFDRTIIEIIKELKTNDKKIKEINKRKSLVSLFKCDLIKKSDFIDEIEFIFNIRWGYIFVLLLQ